jgi:maltose alpha-D-glucosyltransferase/alpha-amylase
MVRSFSYAAQSAALRRHAGSTDPAAAEKLARWEHDARHHFLEGYAKSAAGLESVPADGQSLGALLELFLIEKALYELRYEAANRPDWIAIPLENPNVSDPLEDLLRSISTRVSHVFMNGMQVI